jgi:hypothetical protein
MPKNLQRPRPSVDPGLLCLLAVAVIINLPGLLGYILPIHDSMYMFQTFYFFYNDFFLSGDIPRWLPFGLYGVQSDYYIVTLLSPSAYFAGLVGYLAGMENVLTLFHLSLLIEEVIFVFGTYLLAGCLFRHKGTVFIVSLAALCGSVLMVQFALNFHIYDFLPLVIYLLIRAFSTHQYRYLFISMIVFIISLFGNSAYFAPIPFLAIVIVFIALFLSNLKNLRPFLKPSRKDLAASVFFLSIFLLVTALYYHFISNVMNHAEGVYIGRDPETLKTDLGTFLRYTDELINFGKFKGLVWPSLEFVAQDLTLHVGFITLLFALFGAFFVRRALSIASVAVIIVFGLLSLGDRTPVAELLYHYFPMMKYYRHIGHTVSIYKLFIPLLAGFGLERLLSLMEGGSMKRRSLGLLAEALAAIAVLTGGVVYPLAIAPEKTIYVIITTTVFLAILFSLRYRFGLLKHTVHFLIACFLFQMLGYQALVNATMYTLTERAFPFNKEVISVYDYGYQEARTLAPPGGRARNALTLTNVSRVNYTVIYSFLAWDPCVSIKRVDFTNQHVIDYLKLKQAEFVNLNPWYVTYGKRLALPRDWSFYSSIGCNSSKLKLFKNVIFSDSIEESREIIRNTAAIDRMVVLNGVNEEDRPGRSPAGSLMDYLSKGTIGVKNFSANRLSLDVSVGEEGGAWLYYADAFHPGWKAYVNGNHTAVAQANIAFKAIWLDRGRNNVELVFEHEPARTIGRLLVIFGLVFTAAVIFLTFKTALVKPS